MNNLFFLHHTRTTGNDIGVQAATALGESLKSNTTLTELNLECKNKRKKTHQKTSINNSLFSFLFISTVNKVGETGATSLSEALKLNTALTKLNMGSNTKERRHTKDIHQQIPLSFLLASTGNSIGDTGATSLGEALMSNTTLTDLDLGGEDKRKKTHERHLSTIHSVVK